MNTLFKLLSGIVLLSITGCNSKPPSTYSVIWQKPSVDFTEVEKASLECGISSPYNIDSENSKLDLNEWAMIHGCVIQSGFHYKIKNGKWCEIVKMIEFQCIVQVLSSRGAVSRSA